ncbi:hypothetical protein FLGE108171_15940 [Flavobacterium gelidilacus]|jgi:hypothetical protein|uniref:hypothetical protein n=1 Tax=Flavobacterium gelidilacus TaxID=206041 RepID=UPI00041CEBAC|nr:hypothetical protein [Flavobacterium gelidilacus]
MNKKIFIGLILLIIGTVSQFTIENELTDFFSAILIGAGIGLIVGDRLGKSKSN